MSQTSASKQMNQKSPNDDIDGKVPHVFRALDDCRLKEGLEQLLQSCKSNGRLVMTPWMK